MLAFIFFTLISLMTSKSSVKRPKFSLLIYFRNMKIKALLDSSAKITDEVLERNINLKQRFCCIKKNVLKALFDVKLYTATSIKK